MKITIGDVAKEANVSKTTVSRIVNGNYAHTTEETKKKVLKTIKNLDYRPNALAKGLKSTTTNVLGIVLSNLKNPFWTTVLEGVEDTCRELGYNLMICNSNEELEIEAEYIREFRTRRVDGIVINPTVQNYDLYNNLIEENYPLVIVNRRIPSLEANYVVMDNVKGAYTGVEHLLNTGRKKIAVFVYQNSYVSNWQERVEGYRLALLRNGYSTSDFRILELEQRSERIKDCILDYLKNNPDIQAVFSTNNMITLEVLGAVNEMGLTIPDDLAIVSYDETLWAKYFNPPLTTIRQPGYKMGQLAVEGLIKSINEEKKLDPSTIVLEPELIIRESSDKLQQ
ncbi:LacI family transcriptional regulator [Salibacterium salarium]|uniref:LacI family transcriptional regulator n=1 Tax=Salibacterium salarium TaxID=284579 RepID=A0A3R9QRR1_9BACI|nr:substrate-binding domain-containing protein [Salibacterium salarium]RSL31971.1 LacI family transcriptional regulator [Salibacterium salarium]